MVTWKQLTGDRRLSDALAECDVRGWDALPMAAKEMSRLFPNHWATKKGAERWLAKNPPEAYRDVIRVWGGFRLPAGPRHRRWSKALVRNGANPRLAVAEVLNLSVGEIQVRHGVSC